MARRPIPYEDLLYQDLQDPEEAVAYLNAALDDECAQGAEVFLFSPPRCRQGSWHKTTRSGHATQPGELVPNIVPQGQPAFFYA